MQSIKDKNYIFAPMASIALPVHKHTFWTIALLTGVLVFSFLMGLRMGSLTLTWGDVWQFLQGNTTHNNATETIDELRFPRVVTSMMAGAMMALSGYMLQVVSRNPLADSGLLGLTSGAILVAIGVYAFFPDLPSIYATVATLLGGLLTGVLTLLICKNNMKGLFIILVGIGISTTFGAFIDIILVSLDMEHMVAVMVMVSGSFDAIDGHKMQFLGITFIVMLSSFFIVGRGINTLSLGDKIAVTLGIPTRAMYGLLCVIAILSMAPVVALAGAINFVGLISTFFAKHIIGYRGNELGIVSMMIGAIMTTWADTLGRTLFAPIMVHAGVFIAVVGVVMFIIIARFNKTND